MKDKFGGYPKRIIPFDGSGDGGDGGGDSKTPEDKLKELEAKLAAASESVTKLTNKNQEIISKNKELSESLKNWDGLEPEKIRGLLERIEGDEDMKLIADGKYDEVLKKRTEKVEAKYKTDLQKLNEKLQESDKKIGSYESKIRDLMINSQVVTAFMSEGGIEQATQDVILRAKSTFSIEDGEVVARNSDGEIITGKDGAMTIKEWVISLKENAAHLFPGSRGSGGGGGHGDLTGIDAKIAAASRAGNTAEYRRLRKLKEEQRKKKE